MGGHYSGSEDSVLGGSARSLLGDPEHSQPQCPHPCAALSCPSRSIKAHLQELGKGNLLLKEDKLCIQVPFPQVAAGRTHVLSEIGERRLSTTFNGDYIFWTKTQALYSVRFYPGLSDRVWVPEFRNH